LLNLIAALLHPFQNKNSSELSLPLFATAIRYRYSLPLFAYRYSLPLFATVIHLPLFVTAIHYRYSLPLFATTIRYRYSLPLFATAIRYRYSLPLLLLHLKNFLVLVHRRSIYFEKRNPKMFFCKKLLKKTRDLKKIVIEQL